MEVYIEKGLCEDFSYMLEQTTFAMPSRTSCTKRRSYPSHEETYWGCWKALTNCQDFSALIVVLAQAITIHVYTVIGVPVSTSEAVIGGVLGVGIIKGINTINQRTRLSILGGWFLTPIVSCGVALLINFLSHLRFVSPS